MNKSQILFFGKKNIAFLNATVINVVNFFIGKLWSFHDQPSIALSKSDFNSGKDYRSRTSIASIVGVLLIVGVFFFWQATEARAAVPTVRAVGAVAAGTDAITPGMLIEV